MKHLIAVFLLLITLQSFAQDEWIETNTGIADYSAGEKFEVNEISTLENGRILAFIESNSGANGNGVYELNEATWSWTKIAPDSPNAGGFNSIIVDGNRVFDVRRGAVNELNFTTSEWEVVMESVPGIPDGQIFSTESIVNGKLYLRTHVRESDGNALIARFPDQNFQENEMFITIVDLENLSVEYMRNPQNPFIMNVRGGNANMSLVLNDGRAFLNQTWDLRAKEGIGSFYEWTGTNWEAASHGLNAINITGNNFGPVGPLYTDASKSRVFIRTEKGFYEYLKEEGGWTKFFGLTSANFFITENFVFIENIRNGQQVTQVDRAIKISHAANWTGCLSIMRNFMTPNEGGYFLGEPQETLDSEGNCVVNNNGDVENRLGIYRYIPSPNKPGTVQNLHLENGTYLGGAGENFAAEAAYTNDDKLLLAGIYNSNMGVTPTNLLTANNDSKGKIYVMDQWGATVEQVINLGEGIYDMDVEETTGEIAVVGDFGVAVLNSNYTLKWDDSNANMSSDQEGGNRPRVAIAADGKVVVSTTDGINLYEGNGTLMHTNTKLQEQARKVHDVEISTDAAHGQYYVCGFQQAEGNLQVAYLHAYPFVTTNPDRNWQTWGFVRGEVDLGTNGADTRLYRIRAVDGGAVHVAGESAGGGPGGFTVLAYNGKDLTTPIAQNGNDFYTDGTNSCGPCHITFVGQVDPSTGTATRGKFFHGRLSSGKTNTHRVKDGDLDIDEDGNVYLVGQASARIDGRDVFNINGKLIEPYSGDQFVLMTTPNYGTRYLWGAFPKANRGGGKYNRIVARRGKVAYFATTTRGEMMTTEGAIQEEPYNIVRIESATDTLTANDVYLATWQRNVWETANDDEIEYPFISSDSCFIPSNLEELVCGEGGNIINVTEGADLGDLINAYNIITPNGDGINDTWLVEGLEVVGNYQIKVFTKTGQVIFETTDLDNEPWRGRNDGQELPEGVYYYVITFEASKDVKTGYITLIR